MTASAQDARSAAQESSTSPAWSITACVPHSIFPFSIFSMFMSLGRQ